MAQTVRNTVEAYKISDDIQRLAASTRRRHVLVLDLPVEQAGPTTTLARLTRGDVDAVLAGCRVRGCTARTLNSYRGCLRQFASWLLEMGYLKTNVAVHLRNVKTVTARSKRKPISGDQVREMITRAYEQHPRDGVSITLLIFSGCRGGEITNLRWRDVDFTAGTISVYRSKITDSLTLPMPKELAVALLDWAANPLCDGVQPQDYVVPALARRGFIHGKTAYKMSPDWPLNPNHPQTNLRDRVKQLLRDVGETDLVGKGTHTLRRSAANLILAASGDIRAAQHLLGHSSVLITERYLDQDQQAAQYNAVIADWTI